MKTTAPNNIDIIVANCKPLEQKDVLQQKRIQRLAYQKGREEADN